LFTLENNDVHRRTARFNGIYRELERSGGARGMREAGLKQRSAMLCRATQEIGRVVATGLPAFVSMWTTLARSVTWQMRQVSCW
jgi:hypothetical protein